MPTGNNTAIVDSSVLVAFFNRNDEFFDRANEILASQKAPLLLQDIVFHETVALLRKRVSKSVATKAAQELTTSAFFRLQIGTLEVVAEAVNLFVEKKAKYSFADCVIVVVALRQKMPVISFDRHFRDFKITLIA